MFQSTYPARNGQGEHLGPFGLKSRPWKDYRPRCRAVSVPTLNSKGVVDMMWWDGGHWYWGVVMMIVFWGAIVAIVYLAFRGSANHEHRPSARELLDERLAKGELSEEEYERKRAALEGRAAARGL